MLYDYDESPKELEALRVLLRKAKHLAESLPSTEQLEAISEALKAAGLTRGTGAGLAREIIEFAEAHANYKREQFFSHHPHLRPSPVRLVKP